jgi:hypothetical protein
MFGLGERLGPLPTNRSGEQTSLSAAILMLCALTAFCLLLLNRRLRAKEVVRG